MSGWTRWSSEDIEKLRAMHKKGCEDEEIAKELGRSETTVESRRYQLGLNTNNNQVQPWTTENEEELKIYFNEGLKDNEIAEKIGRTRAAVQVRRSSLGLTRKPSSNPRKWTSEDHQLLKDYAEQGLTNKEIGGKLNRTADAINVRRSTFGIGVKRRSRNLKEKQLSKSVQKRIEEEKNKDYSRIGIVKSKHQIDKKLSAGEEYLVDTRNHQHLNGGRSKRIMKYIYSTDHLLVFQGNNYKETFRKLDIASGYPIIREPKQADYSKIQKGEII